MSFMSPGQRVWFWVLLLAALIVTALIASDRAESFTDRTCPWEQDCATPASIKEDSNE